MGMSLKDFVTKVQSNPAIKAEFVTNPGQVAAKNGVDSVGVDYVVNHKFEDVVSYVNSDGYVEGVASSVNAAK